MGFLFTYRNISTMVLEVMPCILLAAAICEKNYIFNTCFLRHSHSGSSNDNYCLRFSHCQNHSFVGCHAHLRPAILLGLNRGTIFEKWLNPVAGYILAETLEQNFSLMKLEKNRLLGWVRHTYIRSKIASDGKSPTQAFCSESICDLEHELGA